MMHLLETMPVGLFFFLLPHIYLAQTKSERDLGMALPNLVLFCSTFTLSDARRGLNVKCSKEKAW